MTERSFRHSYKYLEDIGLSILTKTDNLHVKSRMPPKVKGKHFTNLEYLVDARLIWLSPSNKVPSSSYDDSSEFSYFEQEFKIISKIGEGCFGSVFKVLSKADGKFYAVKVSKEPFRNDFDRSLKLDEVVQHERFSKNPNVVSLISAWEEDRYLFMQLQLCQSNMLRHQSISEKECWNILCDILLALEQIHEVGIAHLDVKLENILLGYDDLYKLSDFGLMFNLKESQNKKPNEGDAKYLAPELLSSTETFSTKADIFSLGISLLELVGNLSLPSNGQVWKALREDRFPYAQTKHISDDLFLIITRMMSSDSEQRPSAKEILNMPPVKAIVHQRKGSIRQLANVLPILCSSIQPLLVAMASTLALCYLAKKALQLENKDSSSPYLESNSANDESGNCLPSCSSSGSEVSPQVLQQMESGCNARQWDVSSVKQPSFITSTPFLGNELKDENSCEPNLPSALVGNSSASSSATKEQERNYARDSLVRASTSSDVGEWVQDQLCHPMQKSPFPLPARIRTPMSMVTNDEYSSSIHYPSPSIMQYGLSPLRLSQKLKDEVQSRKSELEEKREKARKRLFSFDAEEEGDKNDTNQFCEPLPKTIKPNSDSKNTRKRLIAPRDLSKDFSDD